MKKTIEISGQPMEFEASAMTDHMADHIFGINISYAVQHSDDATMTELVKKLAFVLNKRAELGGWRAVEELSEEDYLDWLDSIDSFALETNAKEILNLYANNKKTAVSPKNTNSPQPE